MSPKLAPPGAHPWGDPMEVYEVEKCTAGGIPVLIGQLYFIRPDLGESDIKLSHLSMYVV